MPHPIGGLGCSYCVGIRPDPRDPYRVIVRTTAKLAAQATDSPSTLHAVRRLFVVFGGFAVACLLSATAVAHKRPQLQHVTIFGDSSAAALNWAPQALAEIEKGDRVLLELQPCGRLTMPGCFSPPPPSVLTEVRTLGHRLGPTVMVLVGYNDDPHAYADGFDSVVRAMRNNGVKQILWLTLRPVYEQYKVTNEVIRSKSHRWPLVTVVNWAGYSWPHPEWFASDGIHFTGAGAVQFGIYLHRTLQRYGLAGPKSSNSG